jgi:hypothetical protein
MIILLEVHLLSIFFVPILGFGFKINPHFDRIQYKSTDNVFKAKPGRITLFERQELNKSPATFLFTTSEDVEASLADPSSMRVKEITQELKERSAEYSDCFDKDSLVKRLKEARDGTISPKTPPKQETEEAAPNEKGTQTEPQEISRESSINMDASDEIEDSKKAFDKVSVKEELRQMRVAELRTKLGERGIRWSNMIEKEDLVRALSSDMETAANFSASGLLSPSKVTDVDETTLALELDNEANTPLILDGKLLKSKLPLFDRELMAKKLTFFLPFSCSSLTSSVCHLVWAVSAYGSSVFCSSRRAWIQSSVCQNRF